MSDRPCVDFAEVKANVPIPDALAALGLLGLVVYGWRRRG